MLQPYSLIGGRLARASFALAGALGISVPAVSAHAGPTPPAPSRGVNAATEGAVSPHSDAVARNAAVGAAATARPEGNLSIRPFHFRASDEALADLRRRIADTRWPSQELVPDATQGVQLKTMRELARYWQTDYDWRKVEAKLNALPMFVTNIDGLDIRFIHVRSKNKNALPLIITHGWPGSIIEELKVIEPLTNPTAHGGSASDAFDVVIPSLPDYGFQASRPHSAGILFESPAHGPSSWSASGMSDLSHPAVIGVIR